MKRSRLHEVKYQDAQSYGSGQLDKSLLSMSQEFMAIYRRVVSKPLVRRNLINTSLIKLELQNVPSLYEEELLGAEIFWCC